MMVLKSENRRRMTVDLGWELGELLDHLQRCGVMRHRYGAWMSFRVSDIIRIAVYQLGVQLLDEATVLKIVPKGNPLP